MRPKLFPLYIIDIDNRIGLFENVIVGFFPNQPAASLDIDL